MKCERVYDGTGQRVRKYVGESGTYEKHYYVGTNPLLQTTQSGGNVIGENILDANGKVIASRREDAQGGGSRYWLYHYDLQGKMVSMAGVDAQGNLTYGEYNEYDPYGKPEAGSTSDVKNDVKYMGGVSDASGLYYLNARHYDANTGRFLQQDTYKGNPYAPWTQNLYAYCNNNPTSFIDPTGHIAVIDEIVGIILRIARQEQERRIQEKKDAAAAGLKQDYVARNGKMTKEVETKIDVCVSNFYDKQQGNYTNSDEVSAEIGETLWELSQELGFEVAATSANIGGREILGDLYWTDDRIDPLTEKSKGPVIYRDQILDSIKAFGPEARGAVFSFYHGHPKGSDGPIADGNYYSTADLKEAGWHARRGHPALNGKYYAYGTKEVEENGVRKRVMAVSSFEVKNAQNLLDKYNLFHGQ